MALVLLAATAAGAAQPETPALDRLTVQDALRLFEQRNREVLIARRAVEGAEADILSAAAPPNPVLSGSTQGSRSSGIGGGPLRDKRLDTVVGLTQVFERGNKRELRTEAARYNARAAAQDLADVQRQQRVAMLGTYYELLQAQERLRVSTETADLFDRTVDAANKRQKAGDIAPADVARIRVDALRARNDARAAIADRERAQQVLGYMLGIEHEAARIQAADAWPDTLQVDFTPPLQQYVDTRPDVQAAQARIGVAQKNRDLALSLRTRDITAGAIYEHYPGDTSDRSIGLNFSVPLFTRYYYDGEIRRAETELLAAEENLARVRAQAVSELAGYRSSLQSALDRVRRFREVLLASAQKAADAAEFAYTRGAIGVMDLLDARRQLYAARLEAAAVSADYAKALAAWNTAVATAGSAAAGEKNEKPVK